jgi:DNA-binding NarL/FixJ family response regulator
MKASWWNQKGGSRGRRDGASLPELSPLKLPGNNGKESCGGLTDSEKSPPDIGSQAGIYQRQRKAVKETEGSGRRTILGIEKNRPGAGRRKAVGKGFLLDPVAEGRLAFGVGLANQLRRKNSGKAEVFQQMGSAGTGVSGTVAAVFLLAENRLLREALLRVLSKKDDIQVVGAEAYGPDTFEQIISTRANVVVLDSISSVLSDTGVVRELHQLSPAIKVVMVGMEADESVFLRVVQAGAVGYVLKDASALEVARTVRAVAAGEGVCPGSLSGALFQWVTRHKAAIPSLYLKTSLGLSRREQQLVGLIQRGLTNKEMANQLHLSEQTIKNHVHHILRKVGAPDRLSIAEVCRNVGLTV